MDTWVVGQISFWFTAYTIKPALVVDEIIRFWIDICTPGNGVGESDWFSRTYRSIEQTTRRTTTEYDIRQSLRDWDLSYPQIHHELIVRYVVGAVVSVAVTSMYNGLTRRRSHYHDYRY